jgi:hypothetical protein
VSLDALTCVVQKFFGSIAALFCGTPHDSDAIFYYCIGYRTGRAGSLPSRFTDAFSGSVQYCLGHGPLLRSLRTNMKLAKLGPAIIAVSHPAVRAVSSLPPS